MSTKIPLLNLTPIYLQNTDSILNTLIFMNLDQGHDFHDGSARTKTNSGLSTWVDLDFKGKGFLNQISRNIFNSTYRNGTYNLTSNEIFGKNDFIKGSLNTTFIGGSGAYAFVVIDDENLKKIDGTPEEKFVDEIKRNITIKIQNSGEKYYIFAEGDTLGENGRTFNIGTAEDNINFMFLPFYQRVYNGSMHKLWTFNTVKHIYLVKITNLTLLSTETNLEVSNPVFTCEKFTEINNIVPQYVLNFNQFLNGIKKGDKNTFSKRVKKILETKHINIDKLFDKKGILDFSKINETNYPDNLLEIKAIILNQFLHDLMTNNYNPNNIENIVTSGPNSLETEIGADGKFIFKISSLNLLEIIPRGTKYYFENCQFQIFLNFLNMLYSNEKPFIHPNYLCSKQDVIGAKETILTKLASDIENYMSIKNEKTKVLDSDENYISKQYGYITDTNIGSNSSQGTADFLINAFNNTMPIKTQSGGALENLLQVNSRLEPSITAITKQIGKPYSKQVESPIKVILTSLSTKENCQQLSEELKTFIFENFNHDISDLIKCGKTTETASVPAPGLSALTRPTVSDESARTTAETISSAVEPEESKIQEELPKLPQTTVTERGQVLPFDNINNVNELFDLDLPSSFEENSLIEINSKTSRISMNDYVDKYSNNLQLYYNYIPQKEESSIPSNNYFNDCWQSIDFYQKGGVDYPFKFIVASGSLDSSSLGGQSIPQYHPPEVDIYMPIFDLNGLGNLKGVIVRMVVVKEILNNPINSKSTVTVFCHFVYVDFERTNISPPKNIETGLDNASQYPEKFKELLKFVIDNTVYIKNQTVCVDNNELSPDKLNTDENIDFKLVNLYDTSGGRTAERSWYKYYTYTQGPTVKELIVIPVNYNTRREIELGVNFNPVAKGIVDVAEKLIDNSSKLQGIFNTDALKVLFIKLFLVRNKYTGDKSRSTDSLFLNQTKYLEGVQISNDENTLYNAQMFGLNTVWSTSNKSVFYMAPYMTKEGKLPITTGVYIDELNMGLMQNPNIKSSSSVSKEDSSSGKVNAEAQIKSDISDEMTETFTPEFLEKYSNICFINRSRPGYSNYIEVSSNQGLVSSFVDTIYKLREEVDKEIEKFTEYCDSLDDIMKKCRNSFTQDCYNLFTKTTGTLAKDSFPFKINKDFKKIGGNIQDVRNLIKVSYKNLANFKTQLDKSDLDINEIFKTILYLSKAAPWWLDLILDYKIKMLNYYYCKTYNMVITSLDIISRNPENTYTANDIKTKILTKIEPAANCVISSRPLVKPVEENTYLKEYIPKTPDEPGYNADVELKNLEDNEIKYNLATEGFLQKLISNNEAIIRNLSSTNDVNIVRTEVTLAQRQKYYKERKPEPVERATVEVGGDKRPREFDEEDNNSMKKKIMSLKDEDENEMSVQEEHHDEDENENEMSVQEYDKDENGMGIQQEHDDNYENKMGVQEEHDDENAMGVQEAYNKTNITYDSSEIKNFLTNSYKCNAGNRIKNYIELIDEIHKDYNSLIDTEVDINDDTNVLIIKIFLKNIDFINKSFSPKIDYQTIINSFTKVDNSYSVTQMNSLLNLYSSQLDMYTLIGDVMNTDFTSAQLMNLFHYAISDITLIDIEIPYYKYEIERRIMYGPLESKEELPEEVTPTIQSQTTIKPLQQSTIGTPFMRTGLSAEERASIMGNSSTPMDTVNYGYGGNTKKQRNNKKIYKTKNNKKHNKKRTVKRRNKKQRRNSRKH
jgi:hypothetical protein